MTSHNQKRKCHRRRKNPSNCRHTSHQVSPAFPLYAHAFLSLSVVGLPFFDGWKSINFKLPDTGRVTPHCQQPLRQHWRWHLPRGTENRPMEQQIPFWNSSFSGFMLVFGQVYTLASTQMVVVATYVRWLRIQGEVINLCICGSFPPLTPGHCLRNGQNDYTWHEGCLHNHRLPTCYEALLAISWMVMRISSPPWLSLVKGVEVNSLPYFRMELSTSTTSKYCCFCQPEIWDAAKLMSHSKAGILSRPASSKNQLR